MNSQFATLPLYIGCSVKVASPRDRVSARHSKHSLFLMSDH